jgi:hypothetical protein
VLIGISRLRELMSNCYLHKVLDIANSTARCRRWSSILCRIRCIAMRLGMVSTTASGTTCTSWKPTRSFRASCNSWNRGKERERAVMLRGLLVVCALLLLIFWWLMTQVGLPGLPLPDLWSPASSSQQQQQPYSVLGPPSVSAEFINRVLALYHSPAAGSGQALYDDGVRTGIDPVFALAFFLHESSFRTTGEARKTLSLGNERCIPDRPCVDLDRGGYAQMESWEDGFAHWYSLILTLYI